MKKIKENCFAHLNPLRTKTPELSRVFGLQEANELKGTAPKNMTGTKGHGATTIGCTPLKSYFKVIFC